MADKHLFYLDAEEKYDLAYDRMQWMIRRCHFNEKRQKVEGSGLWFVGSARRGLEKGIGRFGIQTTPEAKKRLSALPSTFGEFIYRESQGEL